MSDKPIIFSGPMVRAILEGRKTQTRRVLKPQPNRPAVFRGILTDENTALFNPVRPETIKECQPVKLPHAVGDRIWVKETFTLTQHGAAVYRADAHDETGKRWSEIQPDDPDREVLWKSPIFMPRKKSRLTLTVTDVRVQRLQEISEGDAIAEGCRPFFDHDNPRAVPCPNGKTLDMAPLKGPIDSFRTLWDSINGGTYPWESNPWITAYTFTVKKGNIDQ